MADTSPTKNDDPSNETLLLTILFVGGLILWQVSKMAWLANAASMLALGTGVVLFGSSFVVPIVLAIDSAREEKAATSPTSKRSATRKGYRRALKRLR